MQRLTAYFSGTVQGVGFRYTTLHLAGRHNALSGIVRNLPDGRVLLVAEGPRQDLDALLREIARAMSGYIRNVESHISSATGEFNGFTVAY